LLAVAQRAGEALSLAGGPRPPPSTATATAAPTTSSKKGPAGTGAGTGPSQASPAAASASVSLWAAAAQARDESGMHAMRRLALEVETFVACLWERALLLHAGAAAPAPAAGS